MRELTALTATDAAALIARKEISSEELTRACLDRIAARDSEVRAWAQLDEQRSLDAARAADRSEMRSALHGVPFGIKDVIDTEDFPTEYGSSIYAGHRPTEDAACVRAMRAAGAVPLGKAVTTEFAGPTPHATRHPANPAHTPGGSSSGSAAAVADRQVPIAFGNQTAGSLIRPAAFCGIFGLKTTHGIADQSGILELQPMFDTLGYMARSIPDIQAFLGVVSNVPAMTWAPDRRPRIGLCRTFQWSEAREESRAALLEVAQRLASNGAVVEDVDLPAQYQSLVDTHREVLYHGVYKSLADEHLMLRHRMSPKLQEVLAEGRAVPAELYANGRAIVAQRRSEINEAFDHFDAFICPSAPGEAPAGTATGNPIFQVVWTLLGVPCLNLPVAMGPTGLPVGVQLVGRRHDDASLLALGAKLTAMLGTIPFTTNASGILDVATG